MESLIRITSVNANEGQVLKVGFESQDGPDWFPQSKTIVDYPIEIEEHLEALRLIPDRVFGVEYLDPSVISLTLTYFKPTKKNTNPDPSSLQSVSVVVEVGTPGGKKGRKKLPSVDHLYSPDGSGKARYLLSSECIAIEKICNLLSNSISTESKRGKVFAPVQMSLGFS